MKVLLFILISITSPIYAQTPLDIDSLIKQVRQTAGQERQHQQRREAEFLAQRNQQKQRLKKLKAQLATAKKQSKKLRQQFETNEQTLNQLTQKINQKAGDLNDVFAIVRQNASELQSLVKKSMVSAQYPHRDDFLTPLNATTNNSIAMPDLRKIWLLLLDEMNQTGKVVKFNAPMINANGKESQQSILRAGVFTATSQGHFLRYLPETGKLVELARQPANRYQQLAYELENAKTGLHPMAIDPSKGSILALLVQSPSHWEHIQQGGMIGYLILLLGIIGFCIVLFRAIWLTLIQHRIKQQLKTMTPTTNNPLGRLIQKLNDLSTHNLEILTPHTDEIINTEANHLNFGLTSLTVLAAITPLLGLLGTVTGMIETFQSISLFGTGDPRLMSSGISQALVTTQLGLAVAIPLLLLHSLLHTKANRIVDILDEQSTRLLTQYVKAK